MGFELLRAVLSKNRLASTFDLEVRFLSEDVPPYLTLTAMATS
jgi:hypothetical protein